MDAKAVIETLRAHRAQLEAAGVVHAGVFGSVARGEARNDSDIDVLVDVAPERIRTVYDYAGLKLQVADLFPRKVDVINRAVLRPNVLQRVARDLISAF